MGIRNGDPWAADPEQRQVELWDPAGASWRLGPAQAESRAYHSTALLLPDGRVISAGDDVNGGIDRDTAEIYEPPYLHKGARPVIDRAPQSMPLGASFEVAASGAAATRAVLVAPGATTHANDMNQRLVNLEPPQARPGGRLLLQLPADANVAIPGFYMLFLLSADGVPSVAKFIRVGAAAAGQLEPASQASQPSQPSLTISGALPRMRIVKRKRRFRLTVKVSEPATVTLDALLERGRHRRLKRLVRRPTVKFTTAGSRRVTFRLTRAGLRLLAHRRRAVVRIRAKGAFSAGRSRAVQVRRNLR